MAIAPLVTDGYGNGTFNGSIALVVTDGFGIASVSTGATGGGGFSGGSFSRKKWHTLKKELKKEREEALAAQKTLEAKAQKAKSPKVKVKVSEAADLADMAIAFADEQRLAKLTRAIRAANSARNVASSIRAAQHVISISHQMVRYQKAEQERQKEEDDILAILLKLL